jgi:hypothetical protein
MTVFGPTLPKRGEADGEPNPPAPNHDRDRLNQSQVTTKPGRTCPHAHWSCLVTPGPPGTPLDPALGIALATHGTAARGQRSFRARLRDPREQGTDLGLPVAAVAAESPD